MHGCSFHMGVSVQKGEGNKHRAVQHWYYLTNLPVTNNLTRNIIFPEMYFS